MVYLDNIFAYLKWRGDLTFEKSEFNEVDSLILATIVYLDFKGIVPGPGEGDAISLKEAVRLYKDNIADRRNRMRRRSEELLFFAMAKSKRFADVSLGMFVEETDVTLVKQFAAMHVGFGKNAVYIAFRGTDSTLVGWHEDFNMTYMLPVPAQEAALAYLNETTEGIFQRYWIGGHSKGGNLAMYAAMFCEPAIQKKIKQIYCFDGPGFHRNFEEEPGYLRIASKLTSYMPQDAVIGTLMEHPDASVIITSQETGRGQHEPFSWTVKGTKLERASRRKERRSNGDDSFSAWAMNAAPAEKERFVTLLFSTLEQAGIERFSELNGRKFKVFASFIKTTNQLTAEDKEMFFRVLRLFVNEAAFSGI